MSWNDLSFHSQIREGQNDESMPKNTSTALFPVTCISLSGNCPAWKKIQSSR